MLRSSRRKWTYGIGAGSLCILLACAAWAASPWPSLITFRTLMDAGGVMLDAGLAKHVPKGIRSEVDIAYDASTEDARFDMYRPEAAGDNPLPVIVWVHGGGFIAGSKSHVGNYMKILAGKGYAAIALDYTLAPAAKYPDPVRQVADALHFIVQNAGRLQVDASRIVLAGDSAGAQIAAQVATVISVPDYAQRMNIVAPIPRANLRGLVLFCGVFDPALTENAAQYESFLRVASDAYFGVPDFSKDPRRDEFSIVANVTGAFPPLFISAGNDDPLLAHSKKLASVARSKGVTVDALFFPDRRRPSLPHEYQFYLDDAGRLALARTEAFLKTVLAASAPASRVGINLSAPLSR